MLVNATYDSSVQLRPKCNLILSVEFTVQMRWSGRVREALGEMPNRARMQFSGCWATVEFYVKFDSRCPIFESMSQI